MSNLVVVSRFADAYLQKGNAVYATAHDAASADWLQNTVDLIVGQTTGYYIRRAIVFFDPSVMNEGAGLEYAALHLRCKSLDTPFTVKVLQGGPSDGGDITEPVVVDDFGDILARFEDVCGSQLIDEAAHHDLELETWAISTTGICSFLLIHADDLAGDAPTQQEYATFSARDEVGVGNAINPSGTPVVTNPTTEGFDVTVSYDIGDWHIPTLEITTDEVVADYSNVNVRARFYKLGETYEYGDWVSNIPFNTSLTLHVNGTLEEGESYRAEVQVEIDGVTYLTNVSSEIFEPAAAPPNYPSRPLTRVASIRDVFRAGPTPAYYTEIVLGGLLAQRTKPFAPFVPMEGEPETGQPTAHSSKSQVTIQMYGEYLRTHRKDEIIQTFGKPPTFREFADMAVANPKLLDNPQPQQSSNRSWAPDTSPPKLNPTLKDIVDRTFGNG